MREIDLEQIRKFLKEHPHILQSTQKKLSFPVLKRIHTKLQTGERFGVLKVVNNIIIDGHHRYVSSILLNIEIEQVILDVSNSPDVIDWHQVEIETVDWDHPNRKIKDT